MRAQWLQVPDLKPSESKIVVCITFLMFISIGSVVPVGLGAELPQALVTINRDRTVGTNNLQMGIYIGSYDTGKFKTNSAFRGLAKDANVKMVAFMENRLWEVPHPCTQYPDRWDWTGMDTLIQRIFEMGAEPLIVLGFWYTSGVWTPPSGYSQPTAQQWGAYCAEWVKHFRAVGLPVKYYDVGHETHHYHGGPPIQYVDMTKLRYCISLYKEASSAMRAENPNILIGNDNNMDLDILDEHLNQGATFDFLCWHRYVTGRKSTATSTLIHDSENHEGGVMGPSNWIEPSRQKYYDAKGKWLPVIQAGGNLNYAYSGGTDERLQNMVGAVCMALNFKLLMLKDVEYNNVYTFGGKGDQNFGIVNVDTNSPYYPYYVYRMVGPNLGRGDSIVESSSSSTDTATIAWLHDGKLNVLLVNKANGRQDVTLNGVEGEFNFQKIGSTTSGLETGTIRANDVISMNGYTVMLLQTEVSTPPPSPTSIFEDNFDSADFSKWTGTRTSSGGTASVVDTLPYQGGFHGKFTSNGGGEVEYAYCYRTIDEEEVYARGYFHVASGLPLENNDDRFYFIHLRTGSQYSAGVGIRRHDGSDKWVLYGRNGSDWVGPIYAMSPAIETNRWYCIELHWKKHAMHGVVETYVDGERILVIENIDTARFGNVSEISFGLTPALGMQKSLDVYGDCFAVSDTYIGPSPAEPSPQDGEPDIYDVVILALAYGSYPGHPRWDPRADLNGDGIVDIFDLAEIKF